MESSTFQYISPSSLIRSAKAAHPAFKYAIVVAGLFAIVTVVLHFGTSPATLVFGSVIIVVLMVLFLVFAQAVVVAKANLTLPAIVLVWSFLVITIATAIFLFTSAFFNFPLPLKAAITDNSYSTNDSSNNATHRSLSLPSITKTNDVSIGKFSNTMRIRIALIIGNNEYQNAKLSNAVNDAKAIKEKLEAKGFQTIYRINATREVMTTAIEQFKVILSLGGIGVVYYSGHGIQIEGSDYMIPVDVTVSNITASNFIRYAVNITKLLAPIDKIITNTPSSSGDVIMYATSSGGLASDGVDEHSPFAHALLTALDMKEIDVFETFRTIASETEKRSNRKQIPWLSASFNKHFYFDNPSQDINLGILKILFFDTCRNNPFLARSR